MEKLNKLTSRKYFSVQAEPIPESMQKKLDAAGEAGTKKIIRNDIIYSQSAARSDFYPVSGNNTQNNENCVLTTDFRTQEDDYNAWKEINARKIEYYHQIENFEKMLEELLTISNKEEEKEIKNSIRSLEKLKKRYYVPSILGDSKLDNIKQLKK